ncbi:CHAT domain-containing protein [Leptolyngbyaceae cyanobacterium CCMR0082]|uniref:CHAT domain-containing protein n=1 Tax=Adonisia turfae CCMR0082 TaxID=2304604 RepID=A0A6M0S7Z9_9CYAN|nr:CHAT domain-containing protein [Adonisia turfae]NEZ64604.1 CHAT domain-containing protein [Adonisia turfae CCMR0082]
MELSLRFSGSDQLFLTWGDLVTEPREFSVPLDSAVLDEITWYLEVYGCQYITDIDNDRAARIVEQLPVWGAQLFAAVFGTKNAQAWFDAFAQASGLKKVITIEATDGAILALPWELLCFPGGQFLIDAPFGISIRRCSKGNETITTSTTEQKQKLRVLFVVSRPNGVGFLDHRADGIAVLDALEAIGGECFDAEFLRPATFRNLMLRLKDTTLPQVDILHFDGHGIFDHSKGIGSLCFGTQVADQLNPDNVAASVLGKKLSPAGISLVVLSACQSAQIGRDQALGNVAITLLHAGVEAVLAMTHSVLVETTRRLFGAFYGNLAQGMSIAAALDQARLDLRQHSWRGDRRWGTESFALHLQDWFLPALYQSRIDSALLLPQEQTALTKDKTISPETIYGTLPLTPKSGFWGRSWELWKIERAFILGARRVTVSGLSGQGKTLLAAELGRWLVRSRLFEQVRFISYDGYQGIDPVEYVLGIGFGVPDVADVATMLKQIPTLLILDNLEILEGESLDQLLSIAVEWSRLGQSRVLITTRLGQLQHPGYFERAEGEHFALSLEGLSEQDALAFFTQLTEETPPLNGMPQSEIVLDFLRLTNFIPLVIQLLVRQLCDHPLSNVYGELERLLVDENEIVQASLNMSLRHLTDAQQQLIRRLAAFQGGVYEDKLLLITGLGDTYFYFEQLRKALMSLPLPTGKNADEMEQGLDKVFEGMTHPRDLNSGNATWTELRQSLEKYGLVTIEQHSHRQEAPFLRFHPVLISFSRRTITQEEYEYLMKEYRDEYYKLSKELYELYHTDPPLAFEIARYELPNLVSSARSALLTDDENAIDFVDNINRFLIQFGLKRQFAALNSSNFSDSKDCPDKTWFILQYKQSEQFLSSGDFISSKHASWKILGKLPTTPSYNRCRTLELLGRCETETGNVEKAKEHYYEAISVGKLLEPSNLVKQLLGVVYGHLAKLLQDINDFDNAENAYQESMRLSREANNKEGEFVVGMNSGLMDIFRGNLESAKEKFIKSLTYFRSVHSPVLEAGALHNLGLVYEMTNQWDEAEKHYRDSAAIKVHVGNISGMNGAVTSWLQLASVYHKSGKAEPAEIWYRKCLDVFKGSPSYYLHYSTTLTLLGELLLQDPLRLTEARKVAEEALVYRRKIDPQRTAIWRVYELLEKVATKQGETKSALEYAHAANQAKLEWMQSTGN